MLTPVKVKELRLGHFFVCRSDLEYPKENQVYERGEYCRNIHKYSVVRYDDMCEERFVSGDKIVFMGFTFDMNITELYQYISKFYIELWNLGNDYYKQLLSEGIEPEKAEKIVHDTINKVFYKAFNF